MGTNNTDSRSSPYLTRQQKLFAEMQSAGLDALALNPGPSLEYLTGLIFHLSERPVLAFFLPGKPLVIVHAQLESAKTRDLPFPVSPLAYGEDPGTWQQSFNQAYRLCGLARHPQVAIEPRRMRILEYRYLEDSAQGASFPSAEAILANLRMFKDTLELDAIKRAVDIAQLALQRTLPLAKIGMTEKELAAELVMQLYRAGSDPELPFSPIVSSGPNSANPHATPTDRKLTPGDLLVIDWGASHQGYFSDLTRTFSVGEVDREYQKIASITAQANAAGREAAAPGVPALAVDRAARTLIDEAGYGEFFTHRTGHGLGRESHEEPYIRSDNPQILLPGMVFTVEPGIYLPERNGVRVEDNIVITQEGSRSLSNLPRALTPIG